MRSQHQVNSKIRVLIALAVAFSSGSAAAKPKKKPAPAPVPGAAAAPAKAEKPRGPKSVSSYMAVGVGDAQNRPDSELIGMINSFDYLIKAEKIEEKRQGLVIAQATAALALSRNIRIRPNPDQKTKELEKKYSLLAKNTSEAILNSPTAPQKMKTKAIYFSGLAMINLGESEKAQERFLQAIKADPKHEHTPIMSLFVAEMYFEQEKYKEAIDYYRFFFARLTDNQKAIAIYKTAWCHFNLRDMEAAERNFLRIAGNKKAGAFAEDGIKDLAYVMTQHRNETDIIEFTARRLGQNPPLRLEVLEVTYAQFQAQSGTRRYPILFNELMTLEKDTAKKMMIVISNLKAQQRRYASVESFKDFTEVKERMSSWDLTIESPIFLKVKVDLENEIKTLIRSFADTFSGKVQTPEKLEKKFVGGRLQDILSFHVSHFPKSPDVADSYSTWMDVCSDLKEHICAYNVSKQALERKEFPELHHRARLMLLATLEELQKEDRKYREELIANLTDFHQNMKKDPQWLPFTKRLSVLLNEDRNFTASLPLLEKIDSIEKTPESRYRLLWAQFEDGRYEDVVAAKGPFGKDQASRDTVGLIRESHLRLASKRIEKDDFNGYERHIQGFLANQPEPEKRDLVQSDYLKRLLDRGMAEKASEILNPFPASKRFSPVFKPVTARLITELIKQGQFISADRVLRGHQSTPVAKEFASDHLQILLGMGSIADTRGAAPELEKAPREIRSYLLGVLALAQENKLIRYFKNTKVKNSTEKNLLLLAHQIKAERSDVDLDEDTIQTIGWQLPAELRNTGLTKPEQEAKKLRFPDLGTSTKRFTKMVQENAEVTRKLRRRFVKAIEGKLPRVQKRILATATELERKVATLIVESPVPKGLSPDQVKEYEAGIQNLAKEFNDQAEEYKKLEDAVDQTIKHIQDEKKFVFNMDSTKWSVPEVPALNFVNPLIEQKNYAGALIVLDRWKALGELKEEDYHALRVHVLLNRQNSDFMKNHVYGELMALKQDSLVEKWRRQGQ